jgi:hypothetical protein
MVCRDIYKKPSGNTVAIPIGMGCKRKRAFSSFEKNCGECEEWDKLHANLEVPRHNFAMFFPLGKND